MVYDGGLKTRPDFAKSAVLKHKTFVIAFFLDVKNLIWCSDMQRYCVNRNKSHY